jgi:hypothetical protein
MVKKVRGDSLDGGFERRDDGAVGSAWRRPPVVRTSSSSFRRAARRGDLDGRPRIRPLRLASRRPQDLADRPGPGQPEPDARHRRRSEPLWPAGAAGARPRPTARAFFTVQPPAPRAEGGVWPDAKFLTGHSVGGPRSGSLASTARPCAAASRLTSFRRRTIGGPCASTPRSSSSTAPPWTARRPARPWPSTWIRRSWWSAADQPDVRRRRCCATPWPAPAAVAPACSSTRSLGPAAEAFLKAILP